MNKQYILNKLKPYLDNENMINENEFNKLFSHLSQLHKDEIVNLLNSINVKINYDKNKGLKNFTQVKNKIYFEKKINNISNEQLCLIYQKGNKNALDVLIEKNIKFVWSRVKKYSGKYNHKLDDEDLKQYGIMGLMEAAKRFDIKQEVKFITYAQCWVDQKIIRNMLDTGFTVRIPIHYFEQMNKVLKILSQYRNSTKNFKIELAKKEGINEKKFEEILIVKNNILSLTSLNVLVGEDDDSELGNFIIDDFSPTVEEEVEYMQLKENIKIALNTLTDREKNILKLRFGLDDGISKTLEEIGGKYNVTRERIRQIEAKALNKLRHGSNSKYLKNFI